MTLKEGLQRVPLDQLHESPVNPRSITDEAFDRLKLALIEAPDMLQARPLIALPDGEVICGNMRLRALTALDAENPVKDDAKASTPVYVADLNDNERREWMLRDNNEFGDWVQEELADLMAAHQAAGGSMELLGFAQPEVDELLNRAGTGGGGRDLLDEAGPTLADRFGVPPFSVIDSRAWAWRQRKRSWLSLGIKSEGGREGVTGSISSGDPSAGDPQFYDKKKAKEAELGRELTTADFRENHYVDPRGGKDTSLAKNSVSVFDPMLCELVYRWFSGEGQSVIDPFAGGSVRGVVAAKLGREYVGIDLSADQVAANQRQADEILSTSGPDDAFPVWVQGDARNALDLAGDMRPMPDAEAGADGEPAEAPAEQFDLLFTCPPYFNLEVYSDDPADLSRAASWDEFTRSYEACLSGSTQLLANDRFAVIVVGDIREKSGRVLPLVGETQRIMEGLGFDLYDEAIYVTPVGSLRIRAARYFVESRKLGRTHQNVLVFVKGSGKAAADAAGVVDQAALKEAVDVLADDESETTSADD